MLDLTKPVQTKDGRPVRIICTDFKSADPGFKIIALIAGRSCGKEYIRLYDSSGSTGVDSDLDLVNVKVKSGWINLYVYDFGKGQRVFNSELIFNTKKEAERDRTMFSETTKWIGEPIEIHWEE